MDLQRQRVLRVPVVELDLEALPSRGRTRYCRDGPPAPPAGELGQRGPPDQRLPLEQPVQARSGSRASAPAGARDGRRRRPARPPRPWPRPPGQVVGDHPAVAHAGVEEEALADGMDRHLEDAGEPVALPGEEREVVVAELEVGRVLVAERLEGVVEARVPAAVRRGEARPARSPARGAPGRPAPGSAGSPRGRGRRSGSARATACRNRRRSLRTAGSFS